MPDLNKLNKLYYVPQINGLAQLIRAGNAKRGFVGQPIPQQLCLIHSEVSEALEDVRSGKMVTNISPTGKPEGFPSELADAYIRLLDLAEGCGVDLAYEVALKLTYNDTREFKHGKAF